mgnify:CR=1 FL=1
MTTRDNILFIIMDQFRADCLHGALADHVELPHLRALMGEGAYFANHHSVCNPCGPSRASILTGQYAMNHRAVRNGTPLAADKPTLGTELRRAGYKPLLYGYTDIAQDPRGRDPNDPALHTYEEVAAGFSEVVEMRLEESIPWRAHLKAKGYDVPPYPEIFRPQGDAINAPALYSAEDSDTAFLTDRFLEDIAARPPGWCAHLTYIRPHPPLVAPAPYNTLYNATDMPAAHAPNGAHPFDVIARDKARASNMVVGQTLDDSAETVAALRAVYFGLATEVDHHIGRIIAWLKSSGVWDETLLVVTADHGEMLGDHGIWGKMSHHAAAYHVPLILRVPSGQRGVQITTPTESIDVMPTILERVGLRPPDTVDGRSLLPFVVGQGAARTHSYSELDFGDPIMPTIWQERLDLPENEANLAILRGAAHSLVQFAADLPSLLIEHATGADMSTENPALLAAMTQEMLRHRMRNPEGRFAATKITSEGVQTAAAP